MQNTSGICILYDADRRWSLACSGAVKLSGRPIEELIGRRDEEIWPADMAERLVPFLERAFAKGAVQEFEMTSTLADGRTFTHLVTCVPLFDPENRIHNVMLTALDIGERKRAEEALRRSREELRLTNERFKTALQGAPIAVYNQDLALRYTWIHPSMLGLSSEMCLGKAAREVFERPEDAVAVDDIKREVLQTGVGQRRDVPVHVRGKEKYFHLAVEPLRNRYGTISGVTCAAMDITDAKAAERTVRESEELYRVFFENGALPMAYVSPRGTILRANERYCELTGYTQDELVGMAVLELTHPDDRQEDRQSFAAYLHRRDVLYNSEKRYLRKDGSIRWVSVNARMVSDAEGRLLYSVGIIQDITIRRKAEEALIHAFDQLESRVRQRTAQLESANAALLASEERFRQMSDNVREVFYLTEIKDPKILYVSPGYEEIWQRPCLELYENPSVWLQSVHPEDRSKLTKISCKNPLPRKGVMREYRIVRPDGSIRWILDQATPVVDSDGRVYRIAGVALDVTDRKLAEEALQQVSREREGLQQELLRISEREKQKIAQELHDGLCQHLAGTALMGSLLHRKLAAKGADEAESARKICELLNTSVDEARNLSHGLHPVRDGVGGLEEALAQLSRTITNLFHIRCSFECSEPIEIEDEAAATHLFRIAQEAVNNAIKHGEARRVAISFKRVRGSLVLSIHDDGIGISSKVSKTGGMGMQIMRHRATCIGASVEVRKAGKRGTIVACKLG